MENRYLHGQAAKLIGVTKNTLARWQEKRLAGDPRFADFPAPRRVLSSNYRYFTDEDIQAAIAFKNRTVVLVAESAGETSHSAA